MVWSPLYSILKFGQEDNGMWWAQTVLDGVGAEGTLGWALILGASVLPCPMVAVQSQPLEHSAIVLLSELSLGVG